MLQAKDTEQRCNQLLALHRDFHKRLEAGGNIRLGRLVDRLFDTPVISVKAVEHTFEVSYPTARSDLRRLESFGIVQRLQNASLITYYCGPIYDVIYEGVE